MTMRTISIDFDGVIHSYENGFSGPMTHPIAGADEAILKLQRKGYQVVVCTARTDLDEVRAWWEQYQMPEGIEITNQKPAAIAYIDDRAIRFTNWQDILNYF